jgi:glycosyltransferase involved in cell wall biosynthesis
LLAVKEGGFRKRVLQLILNRANAFTSDSSEVANAMKQNAERDVEVILCNYGADEPTLQLPKEKTIYSNRLHNPLYRIDKIVERFAEFKSSPSGKDWKLILAGSGSESENLNSLIEELGLSDSVDFQGWVEKQQNEENYARSAVWVSIPESDATPISLLEAMYHGCFPVVVNLPSIREWITDGVNGKLVSNVDESFFGSYLNELDSSVARENRKLVDEKGSAKVATACFSNLHRRLIKAPIND